MRLSYKFRGLPYENAGVVAGHTMPRPFISPVHCTYPARLNHPPTHQRPDLQAQRTRIHFSPAALAFVSYGVVLVRIRVRVPVQKTLCALCALLNCVTETRLKLYFGWLVNEKRTSPKTGLYCSSVLKSKPNQPDLEKSRPQ